MRGYAWHLLQQLSILSNLPWVLMGDFNDLRSMKEKKNSNPHPNWLLNGFNQAIECSGLSDFEFQGSQFTWEKGRGTDRWVREKLDRILVSDSWLNMFKNAKAISFEAPSSDHLPLALWPNPVTRSRRHRRFKFENLWIRERRCIEIVQNTWENSSGLRLRDRLDICSKEIWRWGKKLVKDFQLQIDLCKHQMEILRTRTYSNGVHDFFEAQRQCIRLLHQQDMYRKQRAKSFWLKEGDTNSRFFHNSIKARRRGN